MISNFILAWHISRHKSNRLSQLCALTALRIRHEWTKTKGTPERNYTQPVVQSNDEYLGGITHVIATNCRSVHFWTRRPSQPTNFSSSSSSKRLGQKKKKKRMAWKWKSTDTPREICIRNSICGVSSHRHSQSVAQDPVACKMTASDGAEWDGGQGGWRMSMRLGRT